jgi:hypothetical protein
MLSPTSAQRIARGDIPHRNRDPKFFQEELDRRPRGGPGMYVHWWNGNRSYDYWEGHPIAKRIGPDMELFVAGLSSDPDYRGNQNIGHGDEMLFSTLLFFVIGPFCWIIKKYFMIKSPARAAISKSKFYDSIYDFARVHGLHFEISCESSYMCFTDGSEGVQQQMRMVDSPQMLIVRFFWGRLLRIFQNRILA